MAYLSWRPPQLQLLSWRPRCHQSASLGPCRYRRRSLQTRRQPLSSQTPRHWQQRQHLQCIVNRKMSDILTWGPQGKECLKSNCSEMTTSHPVASLFQLPLPHTQ